ncbi:hypothetical protein FBU30_008801 [Linnemannia zychae]|nr:hypothetical protein FBU30_008801 [Linnemannia zychae]
MSILSHSSTTSQAAEALLNRARRLSSNAYERTLPPTSFADGEHTQPSSLFDTHRPRSANMPMLIHRPNTRPSSLTSSSSTSSSPSAETTTRISFTNTSIIISNNEGISLSPTDQTPSQVPTTPEDPNHTSLPSSTTDNAFLDPNRAYTYPCTTLSSSSQTRLTSMSARPRALTLEAIRETRDPEGESTAAMPVSKGLKDHHRKHRSENGGSLVRDILAALRQNTELESPSFHHPNTDFMISPLSPSSSSLLSPEQQCMQEQTQSQESFPLTQDIEKANQSQTTFGVELSTEAVSSPEHGDADTSSADETKEMETPDNASLLSSDDDFLELSQEDLAIDPDHDEKGININAEESVNSTKAINSSIVFPVQQQGRERLRKEGTKEGGKGALLLHRIGVRKNSFTDSSPSTATMSPLESDTSSVRYQATQRSTASGSNHNNHKLSKRSTKLLGKFVPKFLQTSFTPTIATLGNTSPRLQPVGLSPLSARSSRSGSISGQSGQSHHSPVNKVDEIFSTDTSGENSVPSSNKSSYESLRLDLTHAHHYDTNSLSPGYTHMEATSPQYLEFLRSDTHVNSSFMGRRSSCSSATSRISGNSIGSKPSSSISSFDPSEGNDIHRQYGNNSKGSGITYTFEIENEEGNVETNRNIEEASAATMTFGNNEIESTADLEDPPLSPYIIDDDCDDDFFLNSVLRKKPVPPTMESNCDRPFSSRNSVMMGACPSGTNMSNIHSLSTTPSLSGWSSSSSQASTPSPTSPNFLNEQVYPFPVTVSPSNAAAVGSGHGMKSSNNGAMHLHYRSNPLPAPIKLGLDEKRSRLHDAVSEWRRSANISN